MDRLRQALGGGPQLWVKRDDCTGLGMGGNKTRKLEFLCGEARALGTDTLITQGAVQSNHCRQTAAAAALLGMECHLLFENRVQHPDQNYLNSGNVFLDHLFGAQIEEHPAGSNMDAAMQQTAERLTSEGKRPYVIPGGGSNPVGALGYVNCALECISQANQRNLVFDQVIHATGSAGTQAGLVVGFNAMNANLPVLGIGVNAAQEVQEQRVFNLASATADFLGAENIVQASDIVANCDYIGEGYGIPTGGMQEAVLLLARTEGLLFDPVYSGKALAGMIDLIRRGHYSDDDNLLFVHTGGSAGLFGYLSSLTVDSSQDAS